MILPDKQLSLDELIGALKVEAQNILNQQPSDTDKYFEINTRVYMLEIIRDELRRKKDKRK